MEEEVANLTTAGQLFVFLELFRHCTRSVHAALFYAGLFSGAIAFPIYGVVLLRRGAQGYMERVLRGLAERDPWGAAVLTYDALNLLLEATASAAATGMMRQVRRRLMASPPPRAQRAAARSAAPAAPGPCAPT